MRYDILTSECDIMGMERCIYGHARGIGTQIHPSELMFFSFKSASDMSPAATRTESEWQPLLNLVSSRRPEVQRFAKIRTKFHFAQDHFQVAGVLNWIKRPHFQLHLEGRLNLRPTWNRYFGRCSNSDCQVEFISFLRLESLALGIWS
jgi:hypothetical protein